MALTDQLLAVGIVLYPSSEVANEAIQKSVVLEKKFATNYVLDPKRYRPHLSLHQLAIPLYQFDELKDRIRLIASRFNSPIKVEMEGYSLFGPTGLFWDAKRETDDLWQLHSDLVVALSPLGAGYIIPDHAVLLTNQVDIGEQRRLSLRKYANPLAIETFWPHITLTSCKNAIDAPGALTYLESWVTHHSTFEVTSMHLSMVREFGSSPGSLEEFPFDLHT